MGVYHRLTLSTLVAVYILVLVGGIVRSTGSGMGCPDWPKCFGSWVPPTSAEQLPENYKEIYSQYRHKKNERFARMLSLVGMDETATAILNDPGVLKENDFNASKTLIEYVNRLVGVLIGLLIIAVAAVSMKFWSRKRKITIVSFAALALVIFQGWIGSFVVSTNLTPWTITLHMFLALLLVCMLVYLVHISRKREKIASSLGFWWLTASMGLLAVQILLGTQVREAIDAVAAIFTRDQWIVQIDHTFKIHRSFSWIVLLVHVGFIVRMWKMQAVSSLPFVLIVLVVLTILTGAGMAYFAIPPFLQPIHLLLATVTFGLQFMFMLRMNRKTEIELS